MKYKQVSLRRERLEMSPVFATAFQHGSHTLGYIRLVNFSQHAAADMQKAITALQARCWGALAPISGACNISACVQIADIPRSQ